MDVGLVNPWVALGWVGTSATWQERMSQQVTVPAEVLQQFPQSDWKRPAGRPHTSWMATMKNDLLYHNLSVENVTKLPLDRPLWRLLAAMH